MKTLETLANEILHKLTFETHKSTTQIVVEGLIEAQELVKLCNISHVSKSLKCDCKHSGSCRYEAVITETEELCRHKE